jgi:hypothetical protein
MDNVIELRAWRQARSKPGPGSTDPSIRRLEAAIARLERETAARFERSEKLEPALETELLAILGAVASDLVEEATERAEKLAQRLSSRTGS